jgi:hypothetical protein
MKRRKQLKKGRGRGRRRRELSNIQRTLTFGWHVVSICLSHTHVFIIHLLLFLNSGERVKLWEHMINTLLTQFS